VFYVAVSFPHSSYLPAYEDGTESVPKCQHIKFRRRGITQKKAYRNKTVCVGCIERRLLVSIFPYSVVCLNCVVPVSMHCRRCLITVRTKVLQNERLVDFSKRANCWCTFSCSICNQNGHFIRYIKNSHFSGYDDIHKSWKDIISYEEQWPKTETKLKGLPYIEEGCV